MADPTLASVASANACSFLALPEDILSLVFSYLSPKDFLAFCLVSRDAHEYRYDPLYWRTQSSRTFRLPISPLLHADGQRWHFLYKKLRTQTRLFTWGQGVKSNLGRATSRVPRPPRQNPGTVRSRQVHLRAASQWPTETHLPLEVGPVVDLQCGGWSTTVLTSVGRLFTVGILDAADGRNVGPIVDDFTRLEYLTQSTSAIKQFSAGRRHVLALNDDGEILSWGRTDAKGYKILTEGARHFGDKPKKVVAGWEQSSGYFTKTGIVYWRPVSDDDSNDDMLDAVYVEEKVIPGTAAARGIKTGANVGVLTYIILEGYAVWITNESRIFACALETPEETFEVLNYSEEGREFKDLQGSFRSFAVFTASGEVLLGNTTYLGACYSIVSLQEPQTTHQSSADSLGAKRADIPALQYSGVIQLAFGDYHFHALHSDGRITSYGTDPQSCGAYGLGDFNAGSRFRGVIMGAQGVPRDSKLLPVAHLKGRSVWFEPEKKEWLFWMEECGPRFDTSLEQLNSEAGRTMFSEWVEQEGRHWADGPLSRQSKSLPYWGSTEPSGAQALDYDNLGAYFAVSVAAAGWHSGALVLVDERKAEEIRQKWVVTHESSRSVPGEFEQSEAESTEQYVWAGKMFPKITLPDGTQSPGYGPLLQWRDRVPTMADLGLGVDDE